MTDFIGQLFVEYMKAIKTFLLLAFIAFVPSFALANEDPIIIQGIKFTKVTSSEIMKSSGVWNRIEVQIMAKDNPDDGSKSTWVRNVGVTLTLVYRDEKAVDKKSPESLIVLQAEAKIFAAEIGKKIPIVFYIPWEAYQTYRLGGEPFAWSVELSANGTKVPLSKKNLKTMLSKTILKSNDPKKAYESYNKLVSGAVKANKGVLMPLNECPFNVMYYEYYSKGGNNLPIPTYISD